MSGAALWDPTPPWMMLVTGSRSEFTDLLWRLQRDHDRARVVRVRGAKMRRAESLFDELAASFQFPYYFGENWAALEECLVDLAWLPATGYVLGIQDAVQVLAEEPVELPVWFDLLVRSGETWSAPVNDGQPWDRPAIPFHVLLQCQPEEASAATARLESLRVALTITACSAFG